MRPRLSVLFKLGVSASLLLYLFFSIDVRQFSSQLRSAQPLLLVLSFLGYLAGQILSTYRWQLLARPLGFHQPLRVLIVYYFIGMYLNLFAPSLVLGDVGRGLLLAGREGRKALALNSVIADRAVGLIVLLWIMGATLLAVRSYAIPPLIYYGILFGCAVTVLGWRTLPLIVSLLLSPQRRLRVLIEKDLAPYWTNSPLLLKAGSLSALFHLLQIFLHYLIALSLSLPLPWSYLFVFVPLVNILGTLPLSLSGIGIREGGHVFFLSALGIGRERAFAFGLMWTAIVIGTGLVGGLVFLVTGRESPDRPVL